MAEVGELYIRLAFEVDPEGAQRYVDELNKVQAATEKSSTSMKSLARQINQATRPMMIAGMGMVNLGLALGQAGVISQKTAKTITTVGASITAATSGVHLMSAGLASLDAQSKLNEISNKKLFTSIGGMTGALGVLTIAIAAAAYGWTVYQERMAIVRGDFESTTDMLKKVAGQNGGFDMLRAALDNAQTSQWNFATATKEVKTWMRENNTVLWTYGKMLDWVNAKGKELTTFKANLEAVSNALEKMTDDQKDWNDALKEQKVLTEAVEDGVRSLARAKLSLTEATLTAADAEKKLSDAGVLFRMGRMSASEYNKIKLQAESARLSVEEATDAVDDQKKENAENAKKLSDADTVISRMEKKYGNIAKLAADIVTKQKEKTGWEGEIAAAEASITNVNNQMSAIKEQYPGLIEMYDNLKISTYEQWRYWDDIYNTQLKMEDLKSKGFSTGWFGEQQYASSQAVAAGTEGQKSIFDILAMLGIGSHEEGTPYVPKTGLALLHKGEAVVPANQNNYSDTLHIGKVNLGQGYTFDAFLKDRDRALRVKRKMQGFSV